MLFSLNCNLLENIRSFSFLPYINGGVFSRSFFVHLINSFLFLRCCLPVFRILKSRYRRLLLSLQNGIYVKLGNFFFTLLLSAEFSIFSFYASCRDFFAFCSDKLCGVIRIHRFISLLEQRYVRYTLCKADIIKMDPLKMMLTVFINNFFLSNKYFAFAYIKNHFEKRIVQTICTILIL